MVESIKMCSISLSPDTECALDAIAPPSCETQVQGVPAAELRGEIAPRTARTADPKLGMGPATAVVEAMEEKFVAYTAALVPRFEKPAIVGSRSVTLAFLATQDVFDLVPYIVAQ
ncbi:hypothetical protein CS8_050160 [Cupriavidus sp. 8B]